MSGENFSITKYVIISDDIDDIPRSQISHETSDIFFNLFVMY